MITEYMGSINLYHKWVFNRYNRHCSTLTNSISAPLLLSVNLKVFFSQDFTEHFYSNISIWNFRLNIYYNKLFIQCFKSNPIFNKNLNILLYSKKHYIVHIHTIRTVQHKNTCKFTTPTMFGTNYCCFSV